MKTYKTELKLNNEQQNKVNQTLGVCRVVYNKFLDYNFTNYKNGDEHTSGMTYSKYLNNEFIPNNPEYNWIKDVSSKAVKQAIMNADKAFKNFFNKGAGKPKFKNKNHNNSSFYFVKGSCYVERHRIKIPTLGWVQLREFGYIPVDVIIKSGVITKRAGRYFISILTEETNNVDTSDAIKTKGLGIDLGIRKYATCSDGRVFGNINKSQRVIKLERRLKRAKRKFSRSMIAFKKGLGEGRNLEKNRLLVQRISFRLSNIRRSHMRSVVDSIVSVNNLPSYISIENLDVKGMLKNKWLSKVISDCQFHSFRLYLTQQCEKYGVELRVVDRWYPSSKRCNACGHINDIGSKEEITCGGCNKVFDRDENASYNLRDVDSYEVA